LARLGIDDNDDGDDASAWARRTYREFSEFRAQAYDYRKEAEDNLRESAAAFRTELDGIRKDVRDSVDVIRRDARGTSRWAIGAAIGVIVAITAGVVPDYIALLKKTEDMVTRQTTMLEHEVEEDKAIESLNQRLRIIEMMRDGKR
jgi:hypothetical protein